MKLFDIKPRDRSLLMLDLFAMLGLQELPMNEKTEMTNKLAALTVEYFLGQKLATVIGHEKLVEVITSYQLENPEQSDKMLEELLALVPGSEQQFIDSIVEAKAYMITQQYLTKYQVYSDLVEKESDSAKLEIYKKEKEKAKQRLDFIDQGQWELLVV